VITTEKEGNSKKEIRRSSKEALNRGKEKKVVVLLWSPGVGKSQEGKKTSGG